MDSLEGGAVESLLTVALECSVLAQPGAIRRQSATPATAMARDENTELESGLEGTAGIAKSSGLERLGS
ncbi:MAG TPA: hypothetical protein VGQ14_08025 [Candidatus Eisenbacteria bacterium]|nr:hypothetical protein [Candidatus Eisenbacteria bacterium]